METRLADPDRSSVPGAVYWITGLAGVGKSTLARAIAARLAAQARPAIRIEGDRLWPILGARYGPGLADRHAMALTYARLCQEFSHQGTDVICASICLDDEARRWARARIVDYREIYLRASPDLLAARLPKGMIAAGQAGRLRNVPGVDLPIEAPEAPEVLVNDDGSRSAEEIAAVVFEALWPRRPGQ